ncbi:MAG: hypothetical protein IJX17_04540, partial [Clostridia bacterium]|nr:hypothetical protein [Clostridia bacterium]
MKKIFGLLLICLMTFSFIACECKGCKEIELMGAGDRIHGTYTFANVGVKIKELDDDTYEISGSVEKLDSKEVKEEFKISDSVTHIVAIKLTAIDTDVDTKNVKITVDGNEAYDAEHLNGSDYTFIILEDKTYTTTTIKE